MAAYAPNFETDLPADLFQDGDGAAAIRAAVQLPYTLRTHGIRMMMFLGSAAITADAEMRAAALCGFERALGSFEAITQFVLVPAERPGLNGVAAAIFSRVVVRSDDTERALDALGGRARSTLTRLERGDAIPPGDYDDTMRVCYGTFHPAMLALTARMEEAGAEARRDAAAAARAAQARIAAIARTVRLISLNARVEAARAGEAGRAFGVIAGEIKALAEQTQRASAEMGEGVDAIMAQVGGG